MFARSPQGVEIDITVCTNPCLCFCILKELLEGADAPLDICHHAPLIRCAPWMDVLGRVVTRWSEGWILRTIPSKGTLVQPGFGDPIKMKRVRHLEGDLVTMENELVRFPISSLHIGIGEPRTV